MFTRFFVDRPIFATVISVVFVLIGFVAYLTLPVAQYPNVTPPTVSVTAFYPGANSLTVRDTVAAPIEEQVNGVEGMMYMSSRCTNDGTYNLTVTFKLGTDSDMAQVLVQNRVSLALPVIPQLVQNEGISVKKMSPNTLMIVNLISPNKTRDSIYLSNYATIFVKDELGRLEGVAGINYLGRRDYSLRAWLDPDKMAALNLSTMDVIAAIAQQNVQVAAGMIGQEPVPRGQQFQLTINTKGRLTDPSEFENIIVKASQGRSTPGNSSQATQTPGSNLTQGQMNSQGNTSSTIVGPIPQTTGIVRLKDIARVERGSQQYDQNSTLDGNPTIALSIYQLPGSNALQTADNVYAKMRDLKTRFPDGVDYKIVYDTTPFIRESVNEVFWTFLIAIILVAIVVLLFLQDWRSMILPMIDVPVSLIGTFAIMKLLGFSLNNLTLFGLVLAIGIVVDDAIVVLENIERLIATGLDARTATIKAMDEITGPVLAITLVLSFVFIPCCFLGGVSGQFFRQFAVTIAFSTIISAVNAITMTPSRAVLIFQSENGHGASSVKREALPWWFFGILGGILTGWVGHQHYLESLFNIPPFFDSILPEVGVEQGSPEFPWWIYASISIAYATPGLLLGGVIGYLIIRPVNYLLSLIFRGFNRCFELFTGIYTWSVGKLLFVSILILFLYAGLLGVTAWQFSRTPVGFVPQQDKGYLLLNIQLPDAASSERTTRVMSRIEDNIKKIQGIKHILTVSGQSLVLNANAPNLGSMYIILDEFSKRRDFRQSSDNISLQIQDICRQNVRGGMISIFGAPPIDGLGNTGGYKLIIEDRANLGLAELQNYCQKIVEVASKKPALEKIYNSSATNTPWLYLEIDRTKCLALGIQISDLFSTLQGYLGSYYVNNFNEFGRTWQVNIQADQRFRSEVNDILQYQVRNNQGQMVRLGTLMEIRDDSGPVVVLRYNMYSAGAITADVAPNTSSGEAVAQLREAAEEVLPRSMAHEWTDLAYLQLQAGNSAMIFFGLAVLFVFLVLAAQYESWSLPLAVILVVPMCLFCSLVGIQLIGLEVTIFTQIGFIVLVGLASKNAILIVEFARQQQQSGVPPREAILQACKMRLRPILMTSFAFIIGVIPLVIAEGAGFEMRRSLGTAVFSGMVGVTFFGVFLTPIFYYTIQGLNSSTNKPLQ